jgi:hypothetical protein
MRSIIFFIILGLAAPKCSAQEEVFSKFIGNWEGNGTLFNQPAKFSMSWQPTLNKTFFKLSFNNEIINSDRVFTAEAFYRQENDSTAIGWWFDNRGYDISIKAGIEEDRVLSIWLNNEEKGKTIYQLLSVNSIAVKDFVWKNNKWVEFASSVYNRVE